MLLLQAMVDLVVISQTTPGGHHSGGGGRGNPTSTTVALRLSFDLSLLCRSFDVFLNRRRWRWRLLFLRDHLLAPYTTEQAHVPGHCFNASPLLSTPLVFVIVQTKDNFALAQQETEPSVTPSPCSI